MAGRGLFDDLPDDGAGTAGSPAGAGAADTGDAGGREGRAEAGGDAGAPGRGARGRRRRARRSEGPFAAYAQVAPPLPVDGLFSYGVPEALVGSVVPGVRVKVPFGPRTLSAMVVDVLAEPPPGVDVRALSGLVEDEPLVGPDILALARWVAERTGCSTGEALDATLPRGVRKGRTGRMVEQVALAVSDEVAGAEIEARLEARTQQARVLRHLLDRGGRLETTELMRLAAVSRSPIQTLVKAGLLSSERVRTERDPLLGASVERRPPLTLTDAQRGVRDRIVEAAHEAAARVDADDQLRAAAIAAGAKLADASASRPPAPVFVLHGVTGSGKTEVYLQALGEVVAAGRQGIVLVPEISLTPQTVRRFRERFERVAVLHSHLTDADRHDQWRRIHRGEADVVVGARSAVFAPVPRLGLIVLDEEHETSFKQNNVPRYHAREVAVERARLAGATCVFGTATPSLESWQRALDGPYERLELRERVAGGSPPSVQVVDLTSEERRPGLRLLSDKLRTALADTLREGGQAILFLNRRGWAGVLWCRACRVPLSCPHCAVSMTWHRRLERVVCHYCGHEERPPDTCRTCAGQLAALGFGTERVEDEVRRVLPEARVARMDSDTMGVRGAHEKVLSAFGRREVDVLVGTQMIAKGLDFPNATLVGVVAADSALFLPDFRAAERTFQLLAQVIGRTGRGPRGGRVVVQAYDPRHPAVRAGVVQDMETFARGELATRAELGYPPFGRLVRVVVQGREESAVHKRAGLLGGELRAALGDDPDGPVVLGPAPAPLSRIAEQFRVHLVVKCPGDAHVAAVVVALSGHRAPVRQLRVLVDVDPVAML